MERSNCSVSRCRLFSAFSFSSFFFADFHYFRSCFERFSRTFFEFFGDFSLFLSLSHWICPTSFISLSSLTGILEDFFEFFLFLSNWISSIDNFHSLVDSSFIRIVDNFSSFFVRFIELRMKSQFIFSLFCRWFLYSSLLGFSKLFSNLLTIFLFEIFGSLCSFSCRFYPIFLVVFEKTSLSLLFIDFSLLLFRLLLKFLAMDLY